MRPRCRNRPRPVPTQSHPPIQPYFFVRANKLCGSSLHRPLVPHTIVELYLRCNERNINPGLYGYSCTEYQCGSLINVYKTTLQEQAAACSCTITLLYRKPLWIFTSRCIGIISETSDCLFEYPYVPKYEKQFFVLIITSILRNNPSALYNYTAWYRI